MQELIQEIKQAIEIGLPFKEINILLEKLYTIGVIEGAKVRTPTIPNIEPNKFKEEKRVSWKDIIERSDDKI
jgi:hypothetical protein